MPDNKYCYPDSDVLINKLNIKDERRLFDAEKKLSFVRLQELQNNPVKGKFDFKHLLDIHKYIFQDIYVWAGKTRTVEISKGNSFCTVACINSYAESVFNKYFPQCYENKDDLEKFLKVFAENYADVNALHPFREGNGRTQREFARLVCEKCGYVFDLSCTTHEEMLRASQISFMQGDNTLLQKIFANAIIPTDDYVPDSDNVLRILTIDDLNVYDEESRYEYYEYSEAEALELNKHYMEKIRQMDKQYRKTI